MQVKTIADWDSLVDNVMTVMWEELLVVAVSNGLEVPLASTCFFKNSAFIFYYNTNFTYCVI